MVVPRIDINVARRCDCRVVDFRRNFIVESRICHRHCRAQCRKETFGNIYRDCRNAAVRFYLGSILGVDINRANVKRRILYPRVDLVCHVVIINAQCD